jgi:predicted MFS family arabinose efflux permease
MNLRSYALVTASYWGFTLTDGALRMLVLLHFHALGFSPLQLSYLFLLYEACGILTNLFGGWIGSRTGLKRTLFAGLCLQILALVQLSLLQEGWGRWVSIIYVMAAQALSGIAKDLTKMSAKSTVKFLARDKAGVENHSRLFTWVAVLTGSKNTLKGLGFFLGALLLSQLGFQWALWSMASALVLVLVTGLVGLREDIGKAREPVRFTHLFSKSREINRLSAARLFLFGSRDAWFVVGLPVFLKEVLGWSFSGIGAFMAAWVIGYGLVQAAAPRLLRRSGSLAGGLRATRTWMAILLLVSLGLASTVQWLAYPVLSVLVGLVLFGFVFALNSSVHSYLILAYTDEDQVAVNVGFYYMANACGRLLGTLASGSAYLNGGLVLCLWVSCGMVGIAFLVSLLLPRVNGQVQGIPARAFDA